MSNKAETVNKNSKRTLTPKLRFPEFRDKGGWEEQPLKKMAKFASGGTPSKINPKLWDGDIPWISASAMHDTVVYDSELRVTHEAIGNGTRLAPKGSILILVRGSMLFKRVPICFAERDVAFNQDVKSIRPKRDVVTRYLLYHLIATESRIAINSTGIGAGKIDTEHLKSLIIGVPSCAEQQKIAECLSSLDGLIAAEGRKLAALRDHKRGLMQQLFPQPGQTQPRLRFPEFREKREWTRHTLSHYVSALDAGVSVNGGDRPARNGEIGVLKTSCVTTGTFDHTKNKVVLEPEELGRVKESVQRDTLIISRMNTIELVGANAYVERDIINLHLPDRLWAAKPTANGNMRFLSYILGSDLGRAFLSSLAAGSSGSMKNISKPEVLAIPILVPSIAEQQRIADCLTVLDARIAAQAAKIDALKTHKRGLMQQLFPAPEVS
ncbi:MAG: restriction endonuclease subunit S [Pseudomonadota bacterium]